MSACKVPYGFHSDSNIMHMSVPFIHAHAGRKFAINVFSASRANTLKILSISSDGELLWLAFPLLRASGTERRILR